MLKYDGDFFGGTVLLFTARRNLPGYDYFTPTIK